MLGKLMGITIGADIGNCGTSAVAELAQLKTRDPNVEDLRRRVKRLAADGRADLGKIAEVLGITKAVLRAGILESDQIRQLAIEVRKAGKRGRSRT